MMEAAKTVEAQVKGLPQPESEKSRLGKEAKVHFRFNTVALLRKERPAFFRGQYWLPPLLQGWRERKTHQ